MKRYLAAGMLLVFATAGWAQTTQEVELLSAQRAYQEALNATHAGKNQLLTAQQQLVLAKQRLVEVQNNVAKLEAEVSRLQTTQTAAEQILNSAGARLDAAWSAARP